ncbi:MAG TPA: FG-GAP-like repeat-containing protein [Terracidiphilus sp.]|jgi:hypothetical protein
MLWLVQSRACACATILAASVLIPVRAFSQTDATFSSHSIYNSSDVLQNVAHGDFNGDGREDLVITDYVPTGISKTLLFLSAGDGTYDAPVTLPQVSYAGNFAVGDFNHDGKLDYASINPNSGWLNVYLGNGDGTFQAPHVIMGFSAPAQQINSFNAADMNGDNKTDIVEVIGGSGSSYIQVWISNGDGTFTAGQRITSNVMTASFAMATGDFDGDGKPDVELIYSNQGQSAVQAWFGDGKGNLASPITWNDPTIEDTFDTTAYAIGNGHSTLIGGRFQYGPSNTSTYLPEIAMLTVNTNRTFAFSTVATTNCPSSFTMADFNGDGVNDLAYSEIPCSAYNSGGNAPYTVVAKYGSSSGTWSAEQTIYTNPYFIGGLNVLKTSQGTRPDILFNYWTQAGPTNAPAPQAIGLLSNDSTTGAFPACGTPNLVEGVNVCAPASASATSPVTFSVSSAGPATMRTAAVWVDGQKLGEQLTHAFSHYSFLDQSISLAAGSHSVTVLGTATDGTMQQKTFTLTVGSGGGSCAAPASPGVKICAPASGANVGSPTQVTAAANIVGTLARMEIWVDGAKLYTETASTSFNTTLNLAAGYHRFDVYAVNTAGTKYEATTYATVGNSACAADTAYDVHVCSPLSGSTDSSPVRALATAHIVGALNRMEVWVDSVKKYTETNSLTLDTPLPLAAGQHHFDFYAVNTAGTKYETTVYATVP